MRDQVFYIFVLGGVCGDCVCGIIGKNPQREKEER